jgi:hypothetical protein
MKSRIIAGALAVACILGGSVSAQAYTAPERATSTVTYTPGPNTVGTEQVKYRSLTAADYGLGSVWGGHIHDNTIPWSKLGSDIRSQITKATTTSNAALAKASQGPADGSVHLDTLDANVQRMLTTDANTPDVFGKLVWSVAGDYKNIEHIGGSYATRATELTAFNLPADTGTYNLEVNAVFDRLNYNEAGYLTPDTDTYPQLTVRCENEWGDAGEHATATTMGVPISKKGKIELTSHTSGVVGVSDPDHRRVCHVRGFGYNEDESGFGGVDNGATPQFKVAYDIRIYRVS